MRLGQVTKRTLDHERGSIYERRWRIDAIVCCPTCGKDVALEAGTEAWVWSKKLQYWRHSEYDACPTGECCGRAIVFNGLEGKCLVMA